METRMDVDGKRRCNDGCCLISESHMGPETHFTNIAHPGTATPRRAPAPARRASRDSQSHTVYISLGALIYSTRMNIAGGVERGRGGRNKVDGRKEGKKRGGGRNRKRETGATLAQLNAHCAYISTS